MRARLLKVLLWIVCVGHLLTGLAGIVSEPVALQAVRLFYGAHVDATPAIVHLLRIIGAYMLGVGILGGVAAWRPERHRPIIIVLALILLLRIAQRLILADEIHLAFGVSYVRNYSETAYFAVLAVGLLVLLPRKEEMTPR